jgi:hypothetical protein
LLTDEEVMRNPAPGMMRNSFMAILTTTPTKNLMLPRSKDPMASTLRGVELADIAPGDPRIIWRSGKQFVSINGRLVSLSDLKRRNRG